MKYDLMESKEPNFSSTFLRRVILLDKVLEDYLPDSYPCDYTSPKGYLEGIASDFFYLIEDHPELLQTDGDRELLAWFYADVYDYITIMKKDELIKYWNLSCNKEESEINESTNNEKRNLIPYIRRRIPADVLLDEFYDSLEKAKEWFERDYKKEFKIMSFSNFEYITLSMTMDGIHWMLMDSSPSDVQWYDHAFEGLKQFFSGMLKKEYNKIIEKNGLLPLNESRIPTETDYLGWEIPRELYDELDKIGVKRYDKKNDKIYIAEFHFDNEAVVFEILDLYGEAYDSSVFDVPIEYNSYHTFKLKDLPKKVKRHLLRRIRPKWIEYFKANNQKSSLNEDLKYWGVSNANPKKNKYKMGSLDEEEDFEEDEVLKETKLQKIVNHYIETLLKGEELPESFLEFKTFTLHKSRAGSKILYVIPVFRDYFINVPYRDWETLEKVFKPLVKKLEAAFVAYFNKVTIKPPKTPENYIKTIKSLSKFGNRI